MEIMVPRSLSPPNRMRRWSSNFALTFLGIVLLSTIPLSGFVVADWASKGSFGLLNRVALPPLFVLVLTCLARSLGSWVLHICMHKVPGLWRIHRIHHLDQFMDISTTTRFHPIEFLLSLTTGMTTTALLGLPVWALLAYEPLEAAIRVFSHANIRLPQWIDQTLRFFISTPGMHRIHHSIYRSETDSNYGTIFSVWDRLFRTYVSPQGKDLARMPLGLEVKEKQKVNSLWWLLENPLLRAGGVAKAGPESKK